MEAEHTGRWDSGGRAPDEAGLVGNRSEQTGRAHLLEEVEGGEQHGALSFCRSLVSRRLVARVNLAEFVEPFSVLAPLGCRRRCHTPTPVARGCGGVRLAGDLHIRVVTWLVRCGASPVGGSSMQLPRANTPMPRRAQFARAGRAAVPPR